MASYYTVKRGDTLSGIALSECGDASLWKKIYPMSPEYPIRLYGGDEWRPVNKLTEGNPHRKYSGNA